jgi:hypothetical protein
MRHQVTWRDSKAIIGYIIPLCVMMVHPPADLHRRLPLATAVVVGALPLLMQMIWGFCPAIQCSLYTNRLGAA